MAHHHDHACVQSPNLLLLPCTHVRFEATMFLSEIEVAVHDRATHRETFDRLSNSIDAKRTTKFSTMVMDTDTNHAAILHELEQERT